jgi:chemotaxis protein methyltransferase CheR
MPKAEGQGGAFARAEDPPVSLREPSPLLPQGGTVSRQALNITAGRVRVGERERMFDACQRDAVQLEAAPVAGAPDHYPFTQDDFTRIRELIYRCAGISLAPGKRDMVYSRLARRLRARQLDCFTDYLEIIEDGDPQEMEAFINALTTNMTSFFREPHHFQVLAERLAQLPKNRPAAIWTCASSTGEEPYSIAMTAADTLGDSPPARILATDIDTNVLAAGRLGVYPVDQVQKLPTELQKRHFLRGEGRNQGFARVREELRQLVTFRQLNLLSDSWPMRRKFDMIFCRNVMIYFDKATQQAILKKLAGCLEPDGLLFVGHSESFHSASDLFTLCGSTVYRLRQ